MASKSLRGESPSSVISTYFSVRCFSQGKTVGVIGAGRIGTAYARMMVEGHKMNLVYYDPYPNKNLQSYVEAYGNLLKSHGEASVTCTRLGTVEDVLKEADVTFCFEAVVKLA